MIKVADTYIVGVKGKNKKEQKLLTWKLRQKFSFGLLKFSKSKRLWFIAFPNVPVNTVLSEIARITQSSSVLFEVGTDINVLENK